MTAGDAHQPPLGGPRAPGGVLDRIVRAGEWHWVLVYVLSLSLVTAWIVARSAGVAPGERLRLWMTCYGSLGILPWIGLVAGIPGRAGRMLRSIPFIVALVGLAWLAASVELWLDQGRPLLWSEIVFRVRDAPSRPLFFETLLSLRVLLFVLSFGALIAGLHAATVRLSRRTSALLTVAAVDAGLLAGLSWAQGGPGDEVAARALCAPWTFNSRYPFGSALSTDAVLEVDVEAARAVRESPASAFWAPGPEPTLAPLAGRYRNRDVVLILLESQRLCGVPPFGDGAQGCAPVSPFLGRLAAEGLAFTNYVATGPATFFAQFSLATGLPAIPTVRNANLHGGEALAGLGRWPDLRAAGYRCEWLQATPITFDSWDRYLERAGVFGWMDRDETYGLDHTYWTGMGMPDEQLYEVAWRRYQRRAGSGTPYFLAVLTVSNHHPFRFPPLPELAGLNGHDAGARYADRCLERFVERLRTLPADRQPLLFITADHGHGFGLHGARPLGLYGLESIRLPGVLVTPDGEGAGRSCGAVFNHEDVLDLLHLLVGPPGPAGTRKFVDRHRIAASTVTDRACSIFTEDAFLFGLTNGAYRVDGRWRLEDGVSPSTRARLHEAHRTLLPQLDRIWKAQDAPSSRGESVGRSSAILDPRP